MGPRRGMAGACRVLFILAACVMRGSGQGKPRGSAEGTSLPLWEGWGRHRRAAPSRAVRRGTARHRGRDRRIPAAFARTGPARPGRVPGAPWQGAFLEPKPQVRGKEDPSHRQRRGSAPGLCPPAPADTCLGPCRRRARARGCVFCKPQRDLQPVPEGSVCSQVRGEAGAGEVFARASLLVRAAQRGAERSRGVGWALYSGEKMLSRGHNPLPRSAPAAAWRLVQRERKNFFSGLCCCQATPGACDSWSRLRRPVLSWLLRLSQPLAAPSLALRPVASWLPLPHHSVALQ